MPVGSHFKTYTKSNYRRTEFIDLPVGSSYVRFLDPEEKVYATHFTHNATFECLGEECPICKNNQKMFFEHGKEAPKMQGFVSQRQVGYINVLDRTPVKICPNPECQHEVKKNGVNFPPACPKCNASLAGVQAKPLDKVKMMAKGKKVFDQLALADVSVLDEVTQTPIGFNNYDFEVIVIGGNTPPVLKALPERNDKVEVPEEMLFDADKAIIHLNADEITDLLRGVSLKDILKARGPESNPAVEGSKDPIDGQVADAINTLFS